MKKLRTPGVVFLMIFLAGLSCGCARPGGVQQQAGDKIVIGAPLSLSGKYAKEGQMALWGAKAVEKWLNEANGGVSLNGRKIPVEFRYYDDESKKESVQSLVERLITVDKVDFLISPYSSDLALASAPLADSRQKVMITHGAATDRVYQQGYKYITQVYTPGSRYQTGFLDMVKNKDPEAKRVAFIYEDDEFSRSVINGARDYANKQGFEVVFDKTYPPKPTDLSPLIQELKAKNPDVIIGGGHFADGQLLTEQLASLEANVKAISINVAPAIPDYYKALGAKAEGIMCPGQWERGVKYSPQAAGEAGVEWFGPSQEEFLSLFSGVASQQPSYHAAGAGACLLIYAKTIEKAQSLNPDKIREELGKLKMMTFFGTWTIDETGKQTGHNMVITQWQGGENMVVWPPEAAVAKLYYPLPAWAEKAKGKQAKE
ncbi:MAG: branched-chain amino acid ABC transporter substrate-binding protein [Peptococcaceae bacterium]|nr:MAG: branched-chain amino acid ABC transporter substrate-binding protein [Peptococcaceae bacterium]